MSNTESVFDNYYIIGHSVIHACSTAHAIFICTCVDPYHISIFRYFLFLRNITEIWPAVSIVWRETSAQHFAAGRGIYGEFDKKYKRAYKNMTCAPHKALTGDDARTIISRAAYDDVFIKRGDEKDVTAAKTLQTATVTATAASTVARSDRHRAVRRRSLDVHYIPFFNATRALWDLHIGSAKADCTHYCYHPVFWQPVWKGIAQAVRQSIFQ
jgi:hypothetical protein